MTERLAALLHEEAEHLDVPVPPLHETLAAGHRVRRRRTLTRVIAVAATVGVVGTVGFGALSGSDQSRSPKDGQVVDAAPLDDVGAVFSVGDTVYLDSGADRLRLPEVAQTFYYTSAGLLVRTNKTGNSDGGAPFHFELIGADRTATPLALTLGEVVPATDPSQPYIAYADLRDGAVDVVVHDVATDREAARVPVPGLGDWGGWEAPPVALDGDTVYVGDMEQTLAVDWRSGAVATAAWLGSGPPFVAGGRAMRTDDEALHVVDLSTGGDLLTFPRDATNPLWAMLSPDGDQALVTSWKPRSTEPELEVFDLDAGTHVRVRGPGWSYGWTPDGDLYGVDATGVHECDSATGECTTTPLPAGLNLGEAFVHVGGRTYES
jgi:hypothetical protein